MSVITSLSTKIFSDVKSVSNSCESDHHHAIWFSQTSGQDLFRSRSDITGYRFAIKDLEIAYITSELVQTQIETIRDYRDNNLPTPSFEESYDITMNFNEAKKKGIVRDPDFKPCVVGIKLRPGLVLLDLYNISSVFYNKISELKICGGREFFDLLHGSTDSSYESSQLVAQKALDSGFNGIQYSAVRMASDGQYCARNIVLFDSSYLKKISEI